MEQAFQAEETSRHACVGHQAVWNDQRGRHKAWVGEMRVERQSEARPRWTSLCRLRGVNFNLEPSRAIEDLHERLEGTDTCVPRCGERGKTAGRISLIQRVSMVTTLRILFLEELVR